MNVYSTILNTLNEMLIQRGYDDIVETEIGEGDESELVVIAEKNGKKIVVFPIIVQKYDKKNFQRTMFLMNNIGTNHSIVVYDSVTPPTKKMIENASNIDNVIEGYLSQELMYNPTKHRLVPKHQLLGDSEAEEFVRLYGKNWPILQKNDVIARFYGFQVGDIVKVVRKNGFIAYRIVA